MAQTAMNRDMRALLSGRQAVRRRAAQVQIAQSGFCPRRKGIVHNCTTRFYVALFNNYQASSENLVMWADRAISEAKAIGLNMIEYFDPVAGMSSLRRWTHG